MPANYSISGAAKIYLKSPFKNDHNTLDKLWLWVTLFPEFCPQKIESWTAGMTKSKTKLDHSSGNPAKFTEFLHSEQDALEGMEGESSENPRKDMLIIRGENLAHSENIYKQNIYTNLFGRLLKGGRGWLWSTGKIFLYARKKKKKKGRVTKEGSLCQRAASKSPLASPINLFPSQNNSALWLSYQDVPSWSCLQCFPS